MAQKKKTAKVVPTPPRKPVKARARPKAAEADDGYPEFEALISNRVDALKGPLFRTRAGDSGNLYDYFLAELPASRRQHYNCRSCRRFFDIYGGIVNLTDEGGVTSPLWDTEDVPEFFLDAVNAVVERVLDSSITGVFLPPGPVWGTPSNEAKDGTHWTHLSGTNPREVFKHSLLTSSQREAEVREGYIMLKAALGEYIPLTAMEAVRVLESDHLDRSEKTLGVARWFVGAHDLNTRLRGQRRNNALWKLAALAPPGWCNIRSTMIHTLLDDITDGRSFDEVRDRWDRKMHPAKYQRPTTVKEGSVRNAERVVEQLESRKSLDRRYATLDDVQCFIWRPAAEQPRREEPEGGPVFGHLLKAGRKANTLDIPPRSISWSGFERDVLMRSHAEPVRIEYLVEPHTRGYYGLVTAADPDAPPVLQWDGLRGFPRNPVSWYFYERGSPPQAWSLEPWAWVPVTGIFLAPHLWHSPGLFQHFGQMRMLSLQGAVDKDRDKGGGFFVETLKSEYHSVRSVLEAHVGSMEVTGKEAGNANGVGISPRGDLNLVLKVRDRITENTYRIDRWD